MSDPSEVSKNSNNDAERVFLHDIATPLMVAAGHVEYLVKHGFEKDPEKALIRTQKAHHNLQKLNQLLQERRQQLKGRPGGA